MLWLLPGALSFLPFLLFDIIKANGKRGAGPVFVLGGALLCASTLGLLLSSSAGNSGWNIACGVLCLVSLAGLTYLLFGALPASTYQGGSGKLALHSVGAYALCRHPAFWCFLLFYWCLYGFVPGAPAFAAAILYPAMNFSYIWVQDRWLFPKYIAGYHAYRAEVPFLLPTRRSIRNFLKAR